MFSMRCKPISIFVITCLFGLSLTGCRGNLVRDEKISQLNDIALVVDVTVIDERTLKAARLDAGKCEEIAERLETAAGRMLDKKGYRAQPMIRSVGLGHDPARSIEVLFDTREHAGAVS